MRAIGYSVILICFLLLSACGFHFRGEQAIAPQLRHLAVTGANPYDPIVLELKQILRSGGVTVEADSSRAPLILRILGEQYNQQLVNVSANSLVKNYNLQYHVSFELSNAKNKLIYGPQTVTSNASYTQSTNQILGDDNLLVRQKQELVRNSVGLILNRLNSTAAHKAMQKAIS